MLLARFRPLRSLPSLQCKLVSRSRAFRSKRHADVTSSAHKRCLFQNFSFCWSRKELENFEFFQNSKLRLNSLNALARLKIKCEFAQSQTRLLTYTYSGHQYDNFQNGRFVQLSNFKEFISFASDFNSSSVRVRPFPIF